MTKFEGKNDAIEISMKKLAEWHDFRKNDLNDLNGITKVIKATLRKCSHFDRIRSRR